MLSGIDDVSDFIPNTYRILTKAITTKYRPKCWGKYFEEKLFSNVMAGISIECCEAINSRSNIVITTNKNSRIDLLVKRANTEWLLEQKTVVIHGAEQTVWNIDIEKSKSMTKKWIEKLNVNTEGILC